MIDFEDNKNLVYYYVNKQYGSRNDKEDLYQVGFIGLLKACKSYEGRNGAKFSTFAIVCIKNEISCYLRKENREKSITFSNLCLPDEYYNEFIEQYLNTEPNYDELNHYIITKNLKPADKIILRLIYNGHTQADICRRYNLSRKKLKQKINQIRYQLIKENTKQERSLRRMDK